MPREDALRRILAGIEAMDEAIAEIGRLYGTETKVVRGGRALWRIEYDVRRSQTAARHSVGANPLGMRARRRASRSARRAGVSRSTRAERRECHVARSNPRRRRDASRNARPRVLRATARNPGTREPGQLPA